MRGILAQCVQGRKPRPAARGLPCQCRMHGLLGQRGVAGDVVVQRFLAGAAVDQRLHAVLEALRHRAFDEDALARELVDDLEAAAGAAFGLGVGQAEFDLQHREAVRVVEHLHGRTSCHATWVRQRRFQGRRRRAVQWRQFQLQRLAARQRGEHGTHRQVLARRVEPDLDPRVVGPGRLAPQLQRAGARRRPAAPAPRVPAPRSARPRRRRGCRRRTASPPRRRAPAPHRPRRWPAAGSSSSAGPARRAAARSPPAGRRR